VRLGSARGTASDEPIADSPSQSGDESNGAECRHRTNADPTHAEPDNGDSNSPGRFNADAAHRGLLGEPRCKFRHQCWQRRSSDDIDLIAASEWESRDHPNHIADECARVASGVDRIPRNAGDRNDDRHAGSRDVDRNLRILADRNERIAQCGVTDFYRQSVCNEHVDLVAAVHDDIAVLDRHVGYIAGPATVHAPIEL
jgi:hypothetical protein